LRADPAVTVTDGMTQVLAVPFAEQSFAEQSFAGEPFTGEARRRNRALALVVGGLAIALLAGIVGWAVRPSAAGQPATVRPPAATASNTQAAHPSPRATAHRPPPVRHPPIPKGHQPKPRKHGHGHHHH
jgi:hypothetical protein